MLLLVDWATVVDWLLLTRGSVAAPGGTLQQSPQLGASSFVPALQLVQRSGLGLAARASAGQIGWRASSLTRSAVVVVFLTQHANDPVLGAAN